LRCVGRRFGSRRPCLPGLRADLRVIPAKQFSLFRFHFLCLFVLLVVHTHQVEKPVDDEQGNFVVIVAGVLRGVPECHSWADDYVTEQHRDILRLGRHAWAGPTGVGRAPAFNRFLIYGERQDVSGAFFAEEPAVELGYRRLIHEEDRQFGIARKALLLEHSLGQVHPAQSIDRVVVLFVRGEYLDGHFYLPGLRLAAQDRLTGDVVGRLIGVVRRDDISNDAVAYHVAARQADKGDAFDPVQHMFQLGQP